MEKIILNFHLTTAIVPWGTSCGWSSAMQNITPRGTNTLPGFRHRSQPRRKSHSQGMLCSPTLPLLKARAFRWAQDSSTSSAPGDASVSASSGFASSLFSLSDFPGPQQKRKVAALCLCDFTQWISSCTWLCALDYITRRWDNTRLGLSSYVVKTFGTVLFSKPPPLIFRNCKPWKTRCSGI